jgi:hypothetical protein
MMQQPTVLHDSRSFDGEQAAVSDGKRRVDRSEATDPPPGRGERRIGSERRDGAGGATGIDA